MSPPEALLRPGTRIGPYTIVRELGRGGMGVVHEAVETSLDRRVALKVVSPALAGDPVFRAHLTTEARVQASLDSPYVLPVFAHGEVDGVLYLVSPYLPDGDLRGRLRTRGPLPTRTALAVVADVAHGLADAHAAGLVHRDIKPSNVLLRERGGRLAAYLADFGVAARASPEARQESAAADVEALARLLLAAVGGRPDRRVRRLLRTALADDPAARPPTAAALRDDLRRAAARAERAPTVRRYGVLTPLVAAALAVGAVAVVRGPATTSGTADAGADEQVAAAHLAAALVAGAGFTADQAACAAGALVRSEGVDRLRAAGVLDDDLAVLARTAAGPRLLGEVVEASASCLFRS
ncbi:serine/threonine-protein kinase [Nocardioides sp. MH1]|uniref:serine/threonine-protein kinase n=1 Tax=Nocardioides sp. MH1 TaxID=3242490 RepID=UPI00351FE38F